MKCPRCENQNPAGTIICGMCGTYLKRRSSPPLQPRETSITGVIHPGEGVAEPLFKAHLITPTEGLSDGGAV